jgi:PLP dependent protein
MSDLTERLRDIRFRMRRAAALRGNNPIKLLAVTKTVPQSAIAQTIELGLTCFGENRVQEALPKIQAFPAAEWHFIGTLQTNKARDAVGRFALIQSLDRWRLAQALQEQAEKTGITVAVLVQVNVGGEKQKGGISPGELPDFLTAMSQLSHIRVEGLMTIPPYADDPEEIRPYFREMYRLFSGRQVAGVHMKWLSMGMSGDFETAIEEGANLVRVGSALFGERY